MDTKREELEELAADPTEMFFEAINLLISLPRNGKLDDYFIKNIWFPAADNLIEAFRIYEAKE